MNNQFIVKWDCPRPKLFDNDNSKFEITHKIAIQLKDSLREQTEKELIDELYKQYQNSDISVVYVIGRKEFENFIRTMLPIYMSKGE